MKIVFCLPNISKQPSGGYKIAFEYANRLQEYGHQVSIVFLTHTQYSRYTSSIFIKNAFGSLYNCIYPRWFKLHKNIQKIATAYIDGRHFPDADIVIATAVETAEIVKNLPLSKGRKFYLIQDFENWQCGDDEVLATYRYGMKNITVSNWLNDLVSKESKNTYLIKNPIDVEIFKVNQAIEERSPFEIGMLYHKAPYKGCSVALEAIKLARQKYPQIKLSLFGTPAEPDFLEDWITYTHRATDIQLQQIYNKASIFVCASIKEGFGLTGAESMASGCAFASTNYLGVHEYAVHDRNALLSEVNNPEELANNIVKLIEDDALRYRLANQAVSDLQEFSWTNAITKINQLFEESM